MSSEDVYMRNGHRGNNVEDGDSDQSVSSDNFVTPSPSLVQSNPYNTRSIAKARSSKSDSQLCKSSNKTELLLRSSSTTVISQRSSQQKRFLLSSSSSSSSFDSEEYLDMLMGSPHMLDNNFSKQIHKKVRFETPSSLLVLSPEAASTGGSAPGRKKDLQGAEHCFCAT